MIKLNFNSFQNSKPSISTEIFIKEELQDSSELLDDQKKFKHDESMEHKNKGTIAKSDVKIEQFVECNIVDETFEQIRNDEFEILPDPLKVVKKKYMKHENNLPIAESDIKTERLDKDLSENSKDSAVKCLQFPKSEEIKSAMVNAQFNCPRCDLKSENAGAFKIHQKSQSNPLMFCQICSFKSCSIGGLAKHRKTYHPENLKCKKCDVTFRNAGGLGKHKLINSSNILQTCSLCSFKSCSRGGLIEHHQLNHVISLRYENTQRRINTWMKLVENTTADGLQKNLEHKIDAVIKRDIAAENSTDNLQTPEIVIKIELEHQEQIESPDNDDPLEVPKMKRLKFT